MSTPRGPLDFGDDEERDARRADEAREAELEARYARRQDPDLEATPAAPRASGRPSSKVGYGWLVGIAVVAALAYITLNTVRTDSASSTGLRVGSKAPPFALPLALSDLDGDANVARKADQGQAGSRPACSVRGPKILNLCEVAARAPVVLAFLATRGGNCETFFDRLNGLRPSFPRVQVVGIAIRGDRGDLRGLIRSHGWDFPIGYDRDGVLANLYGVAVCPQTTFIARGGVVRETSIGQEGDAALRRRFSRLERSAR